MRNEVKRYALSPYNDAGGYAPQMVEVEKLPNPEKREIFYRASDYAALEAECAQLSAQVKTRGNALVGLEQLKDAEIAQLEAERDALAAELAAIRAAGGEAVEAMQIPDPSDCYGFGYVDGTCIQSLRGARWHLEEILDQLPSEPLMTVAQHQRIVAAMAAELEQLRKDAGAEMFLTLSGELARTRKELEAARKQEPFWHAVVSERAPVINKAIRREDVAQEYADKCSEHYQGVEVVPLYRLPPLAGKVAVPRELLERHLSSNGIDGVFDAGENYNTHRELRALLATPSMEVKHGQH